MKDNYVGFNLMRVLTISHDKWTNYFELQPSTAIDLNTGFEVKNDVISGVLFHRLCFLRSECFELQKIIRAQRKCQFSVLVKFITALTTPSQRLALLDVRGRLSKLGQRRNLKRWKTAASPALHRR